MIVEVHVKNHTPQDWQAVITGVSAEFFHDDGKKSEDNRPGISLPSGNGEEILYSANVNCVTQFTVHMAVRDRTGKFQIITRSFKDPNGKKCCEEGQDAVLGKASPMISQKLGIHDDNIAIYEIE